MKQPTVNGTAIFKPYLNFGWMHVHVNRFGVYIHMQEANGHATDHQQAPVGLAQRMLQGSIANVTTIQEQILHPIVASGDGRI